MLDQFANNNEINIWIWKHSTCWYSNCF